MYNSTPFAEAEQKMASTILDWLRRRGMAKSDRLDVPSVGELAELVTFKAYCLGELQEDDRSREVSLKHLVAARPGLQNEPSDASDQ